MSPTANVRNPLSSPAIPRNPRLGSASLPASLSCDSGFRCRQPARGVSGRLGNLHSQGGDALPELAPGYVVDHDPVAAALLFLVELRLAGEHDGFHSGHGPRVAYVFFEDPDVLLELLARQELLRIDDAKERGVADPAGGALAAASPGKGARQNVDHH